MPEFDRFTLAVVDDGYDRRHASDGHSRFGAYLDRHAGLPQDGEPPYTAAEFAVVAWGIATVPVMSPGYVHLRPDLLAVTAHLAEDDPTGLVMRLTAPVPHHALATRPRPGRWLDWERDCHHHGPWSPTVEPIPDHRPTLVLSAYLCLPIPTDVLITPTTNRTGAMLTHEAKASVAVLAEHVNRIAGPALAALLGEAS
ncbi:hypothetical protein ACIRS1_03710 [Kitasatospora sp. NPDC101176]|uniref:hypothetical protein n=1 Tax=Kitasatospora sp. NPDC101176 TaxID=3364099 RepID=UPI003806F022